MVQDKDVLLEVVSRELRYTFGLRINLDAGFCLRRGKAYSVVGPNGCGKSVLGNIIERGWNFMTNKILGDKSALKIRSVEFSDIHSLTGFTEGYYQQRFESTQNEEIPTVRELIDGKISPELWAQLSKELHIDGILDKHVNFLSSGELRKFLLINILSDIPDILIIDNPYIGLDDKSRDMLDDMLSKVTQRGTCVVLLLCAAKDVPDFCDYVLPMHDMHVGVMREWQGSVREEVRQELKALFPPCGDVERLPIETSEANPGSEEIFRLNKCTVGYGSTIILRDESWVVNKGEKCALLGENGSGKSTLLSLVCADNPQSYSNDVTIFGMARGSGESIWDIKRRIGYISPEMHLYFNGIAKVEDVIAQGFSDKVGNYCHASASELIIAREWMQGLGMSALEGRVFSTLSSGEQRLVLLARTLIKQAPLLILDEPLHGLDESRKRLVSKVIERIVEREGMTIVYVTHYVEEIPKCVNNIKRLSPLGR